MEDELLTNHLLRHEQEAALSFRQGLFSEVQPGGVGTLTRADTGPSPLETHPGHRSDYFTIAVRRLGVSLQWTRACDQYFAPRFRTFDLPFFGRHC
jgi:hypothetical protein